jgi:hypothetical protein
MRILLDASKEELSTLVGIGTFYFGPTMRRLAGFAAAGQKPPALGTTVDLPSDPEMRAKGFSERLVLIERLN